MLEKCLVLPSSTITEVILMSGLLEHSQNIDGTASTKYCLTLHILILTVSCPDPLQVVGI